MLKIDIGRSKQFIGLLLILLIGSEIILAVVPLNFWLKIFLMALIFFYWIGIFSWYGWLHHPKVISTIIRTEDEWIIQNRRGENFTVTLCGSSTITRWLCVLRFNVENKKRNCIVFNDAISKDQYRRLLVQVHRPIN